MFIGRSLIETMWRVGHIYLDGRMKYPMELDHFSVDMDGSDDELGNACIWKCATDFEILVANNNVKKREQSLSHIVLSLALTTNVSL